MQTSISKADKTEYVEGNYDLKVGGNFSQLVNGVTNVVSKNDMEIRALRIIAWFT
jgi:hypothetical protein